VTPAAVFLQRLGHRAGAQASLLRLLRQPALRALNPVVVTGEEAWLSRTCTREGIACLVEEFPASRSLMGRLFGNAAFAARVKRRLQDKTVVLVHGNDHLESLLALELGRRLGVPTALFLRSIAMGARDFAKYRCGEHALVAAAGDELRQRAQAWAGSREIFALHDGLEPGDFAPPKAPPGRFPERLLVIGSPLELKGWSDVAAAHARFGGALKLDFTGERPAALAPHPDFRFLGRSEAFRDLVRDYDLAINASRQESFGIAALEVLAAGVPLLSTRVGAIGQVLTDERYLASPGDPADLAARLLALARGWPGCALDVAAVQARIRDRFAAGRAAQRLVDAYRARGLIA